MTGMTTSLILCCTCGTVIAPNPSNQCAACLAAVDIGSLVRRGPGGSDLILYQCRRCRRYDRNGEGRHFVDLEPESPEMMAVILKQIPALSGKQQQHLRRLHGVEALHLLDAIFIWSEPHSMRTRLMLTLKADINEPPRTVSIQQRVKVEFIIQWSQCPDCAKESRRRTWQAIVQLRQKRSHDSNNDASARKGLLILELAIARNAEMRKHIISIQTKKSGFDFYFPSLDKARHFAQYLAKAAPMKTKTSQQLVSEDVKNNTANVRHTISCDMVPLCRDDLLVVDKRGSKGLGVGRLSGRLCLVLKISSVVHLADACPPRASDVIMNCFADLHAENYWKSGAEKTYRVFLSSSRLVRFVVLDVELCEDSRDRFRAAEDSSQLYQGPQSKVNKYALADVEVARESDLGNNDETFRCVTHLGNLVSVGDIVLGYDLTSTVLSSEAEWSMENAFISSFVMPDVVLVRKVKGGGAVEDLSGNVTSESVNHRKGKDKAKSSASKKRERRLKREEKKQRQLEEAAARMGFLEKSADSNNGIDKEDDDDGEGFSEAVELEKAAFEREVELDEELADDLEIVERELALGRGNHAEENPTELDIVEEVEHLNKSIEQQNNC